MLSRVPAAHCSDFRNKQGVGMKKFLPVLALLVAAPATAQTNASVGVTAAKNIWRQAQGYVIAAANQMPEAKYSYRPTASVRTFGELVAHVAGAQMMFCAAALGEPARAEDEFEKTKKTKAELVAALKQSADYCTKAYALNDAAAARKLTMFGQNMDVMTVLSLNGAHDYEHYGNMVTYMRMNNMVPPSSGGGQ